MSNKDNDVSEFHEHFIKCEPIEIEDDIPECSFNNPMIKEENPIEECIVSCPIESENELEIKNEVLFEEENSETQDEDILSTDPLEINYVFRSIPQIRNLLDHNYAFREVQKDLQDGRKLVKDPLESKSKEAKKCHLCGKFFTRTVGLKNHIHLIHEGRKDYKCETCGKLFAEKQKLKNHIRTVHEGHKDYKCKSCDKSFSEVGSLRRHVRTVHDGCKDHKCEFCGNLFTVAQSLRAHIRTIHEGHRDHKCQSCDKTFTHASHLKLHIKSIHEGRRDHKCKFCDKAFSQGGDLKRHISEVHENVSRCFNVLL